MQHVVNELHGFWTNTVCLGAFVSIVCKIETEKLWNVRAESHPRGSFSHELQVQKPPGPLETCK